MTLHNVSVFQVLRYKKETILEKQKKFSTKMFIRM